ncbi:2-deoxy-D-gluconate 3-dehydrogenase [Brevundimonas vesicularis]|jgi:2-deoxy-D-gluconate 3-dehydrogenase|uniref:2-dehydro-3-deoxy-D-gluconate 5-dehydrogenase KduD n=1 Tax=Brevundimonas TaxID=41275 RepID=UPI0007BC981D|nr:MULTISPECIES: 2-dehydro-3-deoxy-D-gluconate 5-dehydrogenase KduD [Brevundimonas]ANC53548.1 2-deoxy-D-gluconate 3-dehydrogenase [Brevundimonas sp. GW460-12-10-14-LB2]MDQ1192515.1 2-deoxy-D-gluconate 3-dehydrogenase [Brevundimonas vesicularis]MEA3474739.1 2-dehydro-3-deoxy-D-gluconate 5-dehydrogenase KduD [Pseudomonadota bacterium]
MSNPFDLTGKVALVTGGNVGLGQGIALALAEAGADIVSVALSDSDDTVAKVQAMGRRAHAISADLTSIEPVERVVQEALAAMGRIDILVNNAGLIRRADAVDFTEADWDLVMNINLKTVFFMSQAVARLFIKQGDGGKIINIASMLSFQGGIRVPSYTASKSGVAGLTKLMANEWAPHRITANAIAPGYFATANTQALREDPVRSAEILGRIPAGRWGEPSDLGGAAVFLASRASDYVQGAILPVDGGWQAR